MSRCSSSSCLNGNCEGCKNGTQWCEDPRCFPDCPSCSSSSNAAGVNTTTSKVLTWILIGLVVLLLILLIIWAWRKPASEVQPVASETVMTRTQYMSPTPRPVVVETARPVGVSTPTPVARESNLRPLPTIDAGSTFSVTNKVSNPVPNTSSPVSPKIGTAGFE